MGQYSAAYSGGFCGTNASSGTTASYCYYSNANTESSKGTALSGTQLKTQSSFSTYDFTTVWGINASINNGTPYLRSTPPWGYYKVIYDGNGSTSGSVPADANIYASGTTATVLGNTGNLAKTGYVFSGWNTWANGLGTARAVGANFGMGSASVILYANWSLPSVNGTTDQGLSETNLNGRTITLTLTGEIFKNELITASNIILNNKPAGHTVASVTKNSTTNTTVTLAYDGMDFDSNISNFSVTVNAAELAAGNDLTSGLMSVLAVNDYESISLSDNHDISTGDEDGKVITVTLTGGTFANTLTPANWTVTNLPAGVTKGTVTRTDATHAAITLSGNATVSYDNNITNVTVSCTAAEYADSTGGASLTAGSGVTLTGALALPFLTVQSPVIPEAAVNNGSVTATQTINLTQGTFNGTDGQPLAGVTFNNLPEGLTATATQVSSTGLRIAFTGNAKQHNADNSISNVSVTVAKTSITGAFGATASGNFEISFMNPAYISVQNPFINERQTDYASGAIDETQTITVTNGTFDDSITNGGVTVNSLPEGLGISVTKNSPTQITIAFTGTAANHANANDVNGATVTIAADKIIGTHAALNTNTFKINFDDPEPVIAASEPLMKETAANNGTVGGTQTLTIFYGEFAEGITAGDITVGSLPSGLGIGEVTRSVDGTQITFALTGMATAHEITNSLTNAAVSVSESTIVPTGSTALTAPVTSSTFEIRFMDAYPVYTITFHENGGPDVSDQTVVFGNTVSRPEAASRAHHAFGGWYQDEALSAPWNFETDIVSKNTALYAMWTEDPKYTVTVNCGANGTVVSDPVVAMVYKGETVTFTITPAKGYKIASLKFNGADVTVNSSGQYTTTALTANVGLAVTFEEKVLTAPTILTVAPAHIGSQTLTVTDEEGNTVEKTINSSFICYATVSNPDDRTIVGYGMLLKDVATGKGIELPVVRSMFKGQFAVRVYGGGFVAGQIYSLQAYVKYVDKNSVTQTVLESQTNLFTWE